MLKPLRQWICDQCGEIINSAETGTVEWICEAHSKNKGFRIVHHRSSSPDAESSDCYHHTRHPGRRFLHLSSFLGAQGLILLYSFLDRGKLHDPVSVGPHISDIREFVEFMRRLTIPYYEEARLHWSKASAEGFFEGANEIVTYFRRR